MNQKYFEVEFNNEKPIVDSEFYRFLVETYGYKADWPNHFYFIDAVLAYLKPKGFELKVDALSPEALDYLEIIYRHFQDMTPHFNPESVFDFNDLFVPVIGKGFYISGGNYKSRWTPTPKFWEMLDKVNVIMEITPENFYFELVGNMLFIKYNQILGSRFICNVERV